MLPSAIPRRGWRNLVTENQEMKGVMKTDGRLPQKPPHLCSLPDLVAYIKAGTSSHSLNCPGHHSWLLDAADGQVVIAPRVLKGEQTSGQSQPLLGSVLGEAAIPLLGFRCFLWVPWGHQTSCRRESMGSTEPRGQRSAYEEVGRCKDLKSRGSV